MMEIEILQGELERLFELEELLALSRDLLGFDPDAVGGAAAKGSFVKALTAHCVEAEAIEALCDALLASRSNVNPKVAQIRVSGVPLQEELSSGSTFGPYELVRKLGEGRLGISYLAKKDGNDFRLKVLRREATRDQRGLHRFQTVSRLVSAIDQAGLPHGVEAGRVGDRFYIAHEYVEGQPLSARIARTGPMHVNEARPILKAILEALATIHERRLSHGDLHLENIIVHRATDGSQQVVLLDAGSDRLRARARVANGQNELFSTVSSPKTVSPELIRGYSSDPRSDVYSFGAMLYEILTGKPVFGNVTATEAAVGHTSRAAEPPSSVAPRGWVTKELDEFVLALLEKEAAKRPKDARTLLEALETLGRTSVVKKGPAISDAELDSRIEALIADPETSEAAVALEAAVEEGADPARVAEAFSMAADVVDPAESKAKKEAKKGLLFRAARIFEHGAKQLEKAEQIYAWLVELDPTDEIASAALEEARRHLGKYEELVEMLLAKSEHAESRAERARALSEIGRLYVQELEDKEQALVAFTQAFCEDAHQTGLADEVDRLAGSNQDAWNEVLAMCSSAVTDESLAPEAKNQLLCRMGRWYADKVSRPDLALPCYQAVIAAEPANEDALEGMTQIYRKAQQWPELGMVLTRRADAAPTPARARDLRSEAAEILEHQLGDIGGARDLYEQVVNEDPGHPKASEALAKIYERTGDHAGYVKILERRMDALRGEEKLKVACRIAEIYEDQLKDDSEAVRRYELVLAQDPHHLDALRGLDRLYSKTGRYKDLLENLQEQIRLAATPRQKITLWERIAGIYDEEFLDHEHAAKAWEAVLDIDNAHDGALSALSRHYRALDRWEDVVSLYERHLKLVTETPRRLELTLARGRVLAEQIGSPERAMSAYEAVLEIDPEHAGALEALARMRESAGDADAALQAIEALAAKATTPEAKAEQFLRAAKLLEQRGDRDGAIERYKLALDANPKDASASASLRAAYAARGDVNAALQLLEREIDQTEGDRSKAKLAAEMAALARDRLKDDKRAEEAAKRSISFDPTNVEALLVLGDLAFEAQRFLEASKHYELIADRADGMEKKTAARTLVRYVDSLAHTRSTEKALTAVDTLLRIAPDDAQALERVAQVTFEQGAPKRAAELYKDLFSRFSDQLTGRDRAHALFRYGESLRRAEQLDDALTQLEEAADLDPSNPEPLKSLASLYESKEDWEHVLKIKTRHLDIATGDDRAQLLMEMGDTASAKLNDRTRAAKSYVAALEDRPDDRRLLTKLMQLYSEEKDWGKLIDVVLRLADFVEDKKQKAKYLHTAAIVSARQMGDLDRALEFYEQVLALDPGMDKALSEAIELTRDKGDHEGVERLLRRKLERATEAKDHETMLVTFTALGELYEKSLGWMDQAIDAHEAAQTLDPDNRERTELLARLYASDPEKYLDKAVASQMALLHQNPYRPDSYKLLRRLYTEVKKPDPAWCLCQALFVLNLAEPDEERFFKRMRSETAAAAQQALSDEDWLNLVMHADADPLLTSLFALIEPPIIAQRGQSLEALGYDARYAIDLARHPYPMSQTLNYAAGVLGMDPPPTFQNTNDPSGLSFLHAHTPAIVLGMAALSADVPMQASAFIAARHLSYFRPGMYVRHLIPSGTGLKSWLFAAIKMIVPQFPIATELEGPVNDALQALDTGMHGQARDHLARIVAKLLQAGAPLDLKRWVAGIDLTADRAGMIVAHDLETAVEIIRASDESSSAVPIQERQKELVLYGVSEPYFQLRKKLGIGIDT
jgi:tetratricopeptide (TPR) repeat protein/tRNA A-37 threonylcarbamoyl transferase component Bud32